MNIILQPLVSLALALIKPKRLCNFPLFTGNLIFSKLQDLKLAENYFFDTARTKSQKITACMF